MSIVKKIKLIADGWKNLAFPTPEIEAMALKRARVCAECIRNVNNTCELCGCPLSAKTRSTNSTCPLKKW